jgi:hypothetical protein
MNRGVTSKENLPIATSRSSAQRPDQVLAGIEIRSGLEALGASRNRALAFKEACKTLLGSHNARQISASEEATI